MTDDDNLLDACHRLDHAASRLFGPQTAVHDGRTVTAPSLWNQLAQERLERGGRGTGRTVADSIPAAKLDLLDLCDEITRSIRAWADNPAGDPAACIDWMAQTAVWRPADAQHVAALAAQITAWTERARDVLDGGSRMEVRAKCPECSSRYFYEQRDDGTTTRTAALQVTTVRARCLACHTTWPPTQYGLLVAVLDQQEETHA